jgi:hypothetical protein
MSFCCCCRGWREGGWGSTRGDFKQREEVESESFVVMVVGGDDDDAVDG